MPENKKRINAFIPIELYSQITQSDKSLTDCVTEALSLYFKPQENSVIENHEKEAMIKELQIRNETLIRELEELQTKGVDNKDKDILQQLQESRITDLQNQLNVKDTQIEKLTETMQAQAVHLQTLLNQKAIEAPGAKKPWWRFW